MGSKKTKKQKRSSKLPKPGRRKVSILLLFLICAGIVGVGIWLFYNKSGMRADLTPEASNSLTSQKDMVLSVSPDTYRNLVGRWMRPDGGYVIEIRNVDSNGQLQAAYFNPRPINVSQARIIDEDREPLIFIELRDIGYPGATYALTYHPKQDMLEGIYYQPSVKQSFEVVFVRIKK